MESEIGAVIVFSPTDFKWTVQISWPHRQSWLTSKRHKTNKKMRMGERYREERACKGLGILRGWWITVTDIPISIGKFANVTKPTQLFDTVPAKLSRMLRSLSFCLSLLGFGLWVLYTWGLSVLWFILCLFPRKLCLTLFRNVLNLLSLLLLGIEKHLFLFGSLPYALEITINTKWGHYSWNLLGVSAPKHIQTV